MRIHVARVTTMAGRAAVAAAALAIVTLAPGTAGARQRAPEANPQRGRAVYQAQCQRCHGDMGRGDGPDARAAGFYPRDFSRGAFQCRCTPPGAPPTDADLMRTITTGLPGTQMPAFSQMPEPDRLAVLEYIKTLSKMLTEMNRALCLSPPAAPPRSPTLVTEGRQLYRLMRCASCHGATGQGDGPASTALRDDAGRAVKPHDFVDISDFKCGNRDLDLYRTILTGMSGTRMPSFVTALVVPSDGFPRSTLENLGTSDEVRDATAYIGRQPTTAQIAAMTEPQKRDMLNRRTWALVQYLRSLFGARR